MALVQSEGKQKSAKQHDPWWSMSSHVGRIFVSFEVRMFFFKAVELNGMWTVQWTKQQRFCMSESLKQRRVAPHPKRKDNCLSACLRMYEGKRPFLVWFLSWAGLVHCLFRSLSAAPSPLPPSYWATGVSDSVGLYLGVWGGQTPISLRRWRVTVSAGYAGVQCTFYTVSVCSSLCIWEWRCKPVCLSRRLRTCVKVYDCVCQCV